MLRFKVENDSLGADEYEQRFREREIKYLQRKVARLGLFLSPLAPSRQLFLSNSPGWRAILHPTRTGAAPVLSTDFLGGNTHI